MTKFISLKEGAGLDIDIDPDTFELQLREPIEIAKKSVRKWAEMKEFVKEAAARPTREEIYYVFRNIARPNEREHIQKTKCRYDITIIPPGAFLGRTKEYFRTAGHYHPEKPGTAMAYPEVYEVLHGRGYFLLQQRMNEEADKLSEIFTVEAGPGEKIMMLPGFGHISINAYEEPLILANWIGDTFEYDYEPYRRFRGGGYWAVEGLIGNTIEFERNSNYREVPEIKKLRPKELPEFGLINRRPLYHLIDDPDKLTFLLFPERFQAGLTVERCFREI